MNATTRAMDDGEDDEDRCVVCCDKLENYSIGECGHKSCCGLCTFRLRQLHSDTRCVICKHNLERVFIVDAKSQASFSELNQRVWGNVGAGGVRVDDVDSSIVFSEDCLGFKSVMDKLRELRCGECQQKFPNVKSLEKHLSMSHGKSLCSLCLEYRGLFFMEHARMSPKELDEHCKHGDGTKSFEGHPTCKFCKGSLFYNNDQLYKHLNEKHETCHICAKSGKRYQYFKDYANLELHFENQHFLCPEPTCRESRFVVFASELQLRAHMASEHPDKMDSKSTSLQLDFLVTGSRRAQMRDHEVASLSHSGSHFQGHQNAEHVPLGSSDDFPTLPSSQPVARSKQAAQPQPRRYSRTASLNTHSLHQAEPFQSLKLLAGPETEQEVRAWCAKVTKGTVSVKDCYDFLWNLLGEVTLGAISRDIKSLLGPSLGNEFDQIRATQKTHRAASNTWDTSQSSQTSGVQHTPSRANPSGVSTMFTDASAFPSLGPPSSVKNGRKPSLSKTQVREIAFSERKLTPARPSPSAAPPLPLNGRKKETEDVQLEVSNASKAGQGKKAKKKSTKATREDVLALAVKFSS